MKWLVVLVFFLCLFPVSVRATETATNVIKQVDKNQVFVTQEFKATMIIAKGKRKLIKTFYGYSKKEGQKSFMEFTNPEDKGVRYLKIDDELWIYFLCSCLCLDQLSVSTSPITVFTYCCCRSCCQPYIVHYSQFIVED